jgi:two-component system phosphate regulon sensor histidine kinase PhoR
VCLCAREAGLSTGGARRNGRPGRRLAGLAETLLANIPDPVILVDGRALVTAANDAARALLPNLKLAQPLSFALRAPNILTAVDRAASAGESSGLEHVERVPIPRAFEVLIGPLRLKDARRGTASSVILFMREVTSARRSEQMRADFVANVSHELRTPLASVLGFIETLQGAAREDRTARDRFLGVMHVQATRMARLIDDLLSLSRIESRAHIRPETPIDLRQVVTHIADASRPLAQAEGVEITIEAAAGPFVVRGDRDELLRLVENLVGNAIKYGASGGRVDISLLDWKGPKETTIELSVRDYGPGIAADDLPRLTERFYRVGSRRQPPAWRNGLRAFHQQARRKPTSRRPGDCQQAQRRSHLPRYASRADRVAHVVSVGRT